MNPKWFVYRNEIVSGPFSAEDIQSRLQGHMLGANDLVWGFGQASWTKLGGWRPGASQPGVTRPRPAPAVVVAAAAPIAPAPTVIAARLEPAARTELAETEAHEQETKSVYLGPQDATRLVAVNAAAAATMTAPVDPNATRLSAESVQAWHFALGGQTQGPLDRAQLIDQLNSAEPLHEVMLWTKGMKEWAPVYEFHDILSELGANKRSFPRADLDGQIVIEVEGAKLAGTLMSISEGGLGARISRPLRSGQNVGVVIKTRAFEREIQVRADVRYLVDGILGLRFVAIAGEDKALINEFVRQSNETRFEVRAA